MGNYQENDIAIIGMSLRVPGADTLEDYWANLRDGVESFTTLTDEQLEANGVDAMTRNHPNYIRRIPVLDDVDCFDASFFGFSPREARFMDPQNRLFLQNAWSALEHAGYSNALNEQLIGIFAGSSSNTYMLHNLIENDDFRESMLLTGIIPGLYLDYLTAICSYKLNLTGPCVAVKSFSATSLVALHMACQSLLAGECDMALAGGVRIFSPQQSGYLYRVGYALSPDGHIRTFDHKARGMVLSSGTGVVVVKRLEEALSDGDRIWAVVRGSAQNANGSKRSSFGAPAVDGQAECIAEALAVSGVHAEDIDFLESHGTGTVLGDPVEMAGLTKAFRTMTDKNGYCAMGTLKPNVGHLGPSGGIASVIKTALMFEAETIPPCINFEAPNPDIDFDNSPFYVPTQAKPWQRGQKQRFAGVSSIGFGGTNCHMIMTEAPKRGAGGPSRDTKILALSAKTAEALGQMRTNLADHLQRYPEMDLADVCYTLLRGRDHFNHRFAVTVNSHEQALDALRDPTVKVGQTALRRRPVCFCFSGQGSAYPGMARELYQTEAKFRAVVERCLQYLVAKTDLDLRKVLLADTQDLQAAGDLLRRTDMAQLALFVFEVALAQLLIDWGVIPKAMIGHSLGEWVAMALAEVYPLETCLDLVRIRGELMQSMPAGAMLAVPLAAETLTSMLDSHLSLAADNAPNRCTVSGPKAALEALAERLASEGHESRFLETDFAFHSASMEAAAKQFADICRNHEPQAPKTPIISNVSGTWLERDALRDGSYWGQHLRHTVRFREGVNTLCGDANMLFLEVGPSLTLASLVRHSQARQDHHRVIACLGRLERETGQAKVAESTHLLKSLGELWREGVTLDWKAFYQGETRLREPLPSYPFAKTRYWVEPDYLKRGEPRKQPGPVQEPEQTELDAPPPSLNTAPALSPLDAQNASQTAMAVAAVWRDCLGMDTIGLHDDFYDLGGDSLLVTRILTRIKLDFGAELRHIDLLNHPTVASFAACLEAALPADHKGPIKDGGSAIPVRQDPSWAHLSFAQERLWLLDQITQAGAAYNMPFAATFEGPLDISALEAALQDIVARHQILRTTFSQDGRRAKQHIHEGSIALKVIDLRAQDAAVARELTDTDAKTPFDLQRDWCFRASLVRLSATQHRLILNFHHIVADMWSIGCFTSELQEAYRARVSGRAANLPKLEIQYADYAAWQQDAKTQKAMFQALEECYESLKGLPEVPRYFVDHPDAKSSFEGAAERFQLAAPMTLALYRFSKEQGVTLYMTMLAAFGVLLGRSSGASDLAIGSPIANRHHPHVEHLLGFFANTLALRLKPEPQVAFSTYLQRVKHVASAAFERQSVPIERIVAMLKPDRQVGRNPVFEASFFMQNAPMPEPDFPMLTVRADHAEASNVRFDLELHLWSHEDQLHGSIIYRKALYLPQTIQAKIQQFQTLLQGILDQPQARIADLPLFSTQEQQPSDTPVPTTHLDHLSDDDVARMLKEMEGDT